MLLELPNGKSHLPDPSAPDYGRPTGRALCGTLPPLGTFWTVFRDTTMHDIPREQLCSRCRRKVERFSRTARGVPR